MSIARRKEREFKQREELILETAYGMMLDHGYIGLTIDKIAEAIDYSKGTIYQHFKNKEDILVAQLARDIQQIRELKTRLVDQQIRTRELVVAMSVISRAFDSYHPGMVQMQQALMERSLWEKASTENKAKVKEEIQICAASELTLIEDAIADGDLSLNLLTKDEILMGFLAHEMGMVGIATEISQPNSFPGLQSFIGNAELDARIKILHTFLDGLNWQPLFKDYDYYTSCQQLIQVIETDAPKLAAKAHEINAKNNKK